MLIVTLRGGEEYFLVKRRLSMVASKALSVEMDSAKRQLMGMEGWGEPVNVMCEARVGSWVGSVGISGLERISSRRRRADSDWTE